MSLDELCTEGYTDGYDLDSPKPGQNRHPAYCHGFRSGRDDAECAAGLRRFPSRTAQQARHAWAVIKESSDVLWQGNT